MTAGDLGELRVCYIVKGGVKRCLSHPTDGRVAQLAEQVTLNH